MKYRKATLKDTDSILELLRSTKELQGSLEVDSVYSREFAEDSILDKERNLVLVAEEEKLIGFLSAEIWQKKRFSFLADLVVIPEFRGRGITTQLYQEYESICKRLGIKVINGFVQAENSLMQNFLEKRSFKRGNNFNYYEKRI